MKISPPRDSRFALIALAVFAFLALATNRWVLVGRIPLPADLLGYFPPWESANITLRQHSEIGDSLTLFYPWRVFQATSLREGVLPLWNPLILGGTPFLGEAQSALFYPFHLLHILLPSPFAWTVTLLMNLIFTGVFTAWFARDIGGTRIGAIAAGVLFSCCGFVVAFQLFSSLADTLIWLPFIFWAVHRLVATPSVPYLILTAAGFALCVFAGHPETAIHVTLAGLAFALWECAALFGKGGATRGLLWFTAAGAIALGLAFVQVIPTFEWVRYIALSPDIRWPARPIHEMFALVSRDITQNPNSSGLFIPEAAAYIAPLALLLVPFAFLHRNRRIPMFFLFMIVVSLQVVWQMGPVHWIVSSVELLARLKNWRVLALLDFSLAVLAGMGLSVLAEEFVTRARRKYAMISCGIAFLLIGTALWALPRTADVKWYWGPGSTSVFLVVGFLLILVRFLSMVSVRTFAVSALLVLALDMGTFRGSALPYVRLREIYPDVPLYQFLRAREPAGYRIAVVDGTTASNFSMPYGVSEIGGWDIELQLTKDFMDDFRDQGGVLSSGPVAKIEDRRLDLMNIRYVVATTVNASAENIAQKPDRYSLAFSDGSVRVFENKTVLARARFLPVGPKTIEVIPDHRAQLARIKESGFDAEGTVILSSIPDNFRIGDHEFSASSPHSVEAISHNANESVYRVGSAEPGILQVSQVFYPGWRAFADGEEVPVLRSNFALVAVALPKGAQIVRLVYDPVSFKVGLAVTLPTLLLGAFLAVRHLLKASRDRKVSA